MRAWRLLSSTLVYIWDGSLCEGDLGLLTNYDYYASYYADRLGNACRDFFDARRFGTFGTRFTGFCDLAWARIEGIRYRFFEGGIVRDFRFGLARLWDRLAANFRAFYGAFRLCEGFRCSEFDFVSLVRICI